LLFRFFERLKCPPLITTYAREQGGEFEGEGDAIEEKKKKQSDTKRKGIDLCALRKINREI